MSVLTEISEGERTGKGSHSGSNLSIASNLDSEVAKGSTVTDNGEVHFGDRLLDDLMNTFCDRLQAACPRKIDGCLAIHVGTRNLKNTSRECRSTTRHHQIIFDPDRVHYVVVDYDPQTRMVVLYDSLVEKDSNVTNLLTEPIRKSKYIRFFHTCFKTRRYLWLFLAAMTDRPIRGPVDIVRLRAWWIWLDNVTLASITEYCMKSIFAFFQKVISESKVEWVEFETAYFGQ
ncbi:hypothetical protein COOONC_12533 [Cooperia oncophora]